MVKASLPEQIATIEEEITKERKKGAKKDKTHLVNMQKKHAALSAEYGRGNTERTNSLKDVEPKKDDSKSS